MPMDLWKEYFGIPRGTYFGPGSIEALKEKDGEKAFIFTDKLIEEIGHVDKVRKVLEEGDKEVAVYTGAEPNPPKSCVEKGLEQMKSFEPDIIVGLGGGSSIDGAKIAWLFYEHPKGDWNSYDLVLDLPKVATKKDRKADLVAVPTTSGTGTEFTGYAVITDEDQDPPWKMPYWDFEIVPNEAILDPELTKTMPPNVTANTGVDALSHAVEGIVSNGADPITDAVNYYGAELVFEWLPKAYSQGENIEARTNMHLAAGMIGMGFGNSGTGNVHACGHQLLAFDVPHGKAMSIMMPYIIEYNAPAAAEKYADLARRIGCKFDTPEEGTRKLIEKIEDLKHAVNHPDAIKDIERIKKSDFDDLLDRMADNAMKDSAVDANPRDTKKEDIINLFERAWKGEKGNYLY